MLPRNFSGKIKKKHIRANHMPVLCVKPFNFESTRVGFEAFFGAPINQ
jgi:hypothetical protein